MRTAALRFCLSGLIVSTLPTLTRAALEYSAKTESAGLFRTEALEPPPLGTLERGEGVKLIHRGEAASLILTSGGIRGWVRNGDLSAVEERAGLKTRLPEQNVTGSGEVNISPIILEDMMTPAEVVSLDRSFSGEIVESMDKEQVEMRFDEN